MRESERETEAETETETETETERREMKTASGDRSAETKHSTENVPTSHSEHSTRTQNEKKSFTCNICDRTFLTLIEYNLHKKVCFPVPDFLSTGMEDVIDTEFRKNNRPRQEEPVPEFLCPLCGERFTNMVWLTKHQSKCQVERTQNCPGQDREIPKQDLKDVNNNIESEKKSLDESLHGDPLSMTESTSEVTPRDGKVEADLDIPKEEAAADTNERCDEVKNVDKSSEKIAENSVPPQVKPRQGEVRPGGEEVSEEKLLEGERKSINIDPRVKAGGKKVEKDGKTIGSPGVKSPAKKDQKREKSKVLDAESSKPDGAKCSGELEVFVVHLAAL